MANKKLKCCPFCGKKPIIKSYWIGEKHLYLVSCGHIECGVTPQTLPHTKKKSAIKTWNRRVKG